MPKQNIHPKWYPEANVVCACGNTWKTGATIPEIRTDICSACHPFYTGEQRIVDTEGQVDRFMKRLQHRDDMRAQVEAREAAKTPMHMSLSEFGLNKRFVSVLADNNVATVQDFIDKLNEGEDSLLELPGIGRKVLTDIKRMLRSRGYDVPETEASVE
ncbi:MAG: 50S ribosomal protein L31 [Anaerolineae bacterium]|jgi:large subunit ribosomal protein L31|nr:50S ribosomal protein L31 [Anaerolineae bacterium]